jgi:hypothetical protein
LIERAGIARVDLHGFLGVRQRFHGPSHAVEQPSQIDVRGREPPVQLQCGLQLVQSLLWVIAPRELRQVIVAQRSVGAGKGEGFS